MGTTTTRVWVLARDDDTSLDELAGEGVEFFRGDRPERFSTAPAPDALFVCMRDDTLLQAILETAPGLRWVHLRSAGIDGMLPERMPRSSIPVTNGRGAFSGPLAEFALASILFFARRFPDLLASRARREWKPIAPREIAGATLAVVGYGDIGRNVASRAVAMGMHVIAVRRRPARPEPESPVELFGPESLVHVLERADHAVVSLPLTDATRGLIGGAELRALGPDAVLVNVGRGAVVREAALVEALRERLLGAAALDVFEIEPLPADHPLYGLDNVLLSPHCADQSPGRVSAAVDVFLANLARFRSGRPLENLVDPTRGY